MLTGDEDAGGSSRSAAPAAAPGTEIGAGRRRRGTSWRGETGESRPRGRKGGESESTREERTLGCPVPGAFYSPVRDHSLNPLQAEISLFGVPPFPSHD